MSFPVSNRPLLSRGLSSRQRPHCHQLRHASLLRRPKRPYTFTQLVTLSDGSAFLHRTTSPLPIYRSTKDTKNSPLWNPSSQKLLNIEEDEAGRLRRFRQRFGRGFDAETMDKTGTEESSDGQETSDESDENLLSLISGFGQQDQKKSGSGGSKEESKKSGKSKGGQK